MNDGDGSIECKRYNVSGNYLLAMRSWRWILPTTETTAELRILSAWTQYVYSLCTTDPVQHGSIQCTLCRINVLV